MSIAFLITTYNRPGSCQKLVDALQGQGTIVVLNDGCDYVINGCDQYFLSSHNGRMAYSETVKILFNLRGHHKYYIMLPDDFLPAPNMVEEALRLWNGIADPQKICLNLYSDRIGQKCWTDFDPIDMGEYYRTGWVDMCFLCEEKFFLLSQLDRNAKPSGFRLSSGVGSTISRVLFRRGMSFFQVKESLVIPQEEHLTSQMHSQIQVNNDSRRRRIHPHTSRSSLQGRRQHRRPGR